MASQKDYYIAEGISEDAGEQVEMPPNVELKGTGINKLSYWVTNDCKKKYIRQSNIYLLIKKVIFGEWIELPIITPEQLLVARKIKYVFTGDLEKDVIINPYFFGKEKHLVNILFF